MLVLVGAVLATAAFSRKGNRRTGLKPTLRGIVVQPLM